MDVLIRNATVRGRDGTVDIGIEDGRISQLSHDIQQPASEQIDANDGLVLPPFVESHTHLDMAFFENEAPPRETGLHAECIDLALTAMENISLEDIEANARRAVERFVANGSTHIRIHVCVTEE